MKKVRKHKNERILNPFIISSIMLIIKCLTVIKYSFRNIFIKHLASSKNTHYLCAH
jgi:hypothetical protein